MNPKGARLDLPVIRLFGALTIEDGTRTLGPRNLGGARPKQVLEILLASRGHRVSTDRLAELLWGDARPQNWSGSIQTFVSTLRRNLAPDRERGRELVVTENEAYRFATDLVKLDLDRFDKLLERSASEPTYASRRSLECALELVRGPVLEDEPYATWAQELRGTYDGRVLGARLDAADAALAELDYARALAHTEAAAALDAFSERAHRTSMLALYALGRQHDALSAYRAFRARLDEELGLEPTSETRALERGILRQEDVSALLPRPIRRANADTGKAPVRLLGRTDELDTLDQRIGQALDGSFALLLIEGEAGLGKTRLLDELAVRLVGAPVGRASCSQLEQHLPYVPLAAALRDALGDTCVESGRLPALGRILPELLLGEPQQAHAELEALEALVALIAEHGPLVLLIDDLEWADAATVAALRYLQLRCTSPAALVGTVRSGELSPDHPLRRLTPDALVVLEPLTPAELAPLGIPGLHSSTGGNPRFVSEAVATGGRPALSSSLSDALLAQCRAEGDYAYRVLVAASVLDQPFEPAPLAAVLRADAAELTEELERLCERRLLRVDGFRFRFRYDVVRQVLLASVSPARRRLLHMSLHAAGGGLLVPLAQVSHSRGG